jgi:hypothetical protein
MSNNTLSSDSMSKVYELCVEKTPAAPGAVMAAENSKGRGTACTVHTENRTAVGADNGNSRTHKISREEQPVRSF